MSRSFTAGLAVAVVIVIASCSTTPPPSASAQPSSTLPLASPSPPTLPLARASLATDKPIASGPPLARLAAEGGDPTVGQLGTYTWGDGGSDSPWLRGARIAVGSGEPLKVTFAPTARVGSWRARAVPSTSDGPAGALVLGQGSGTPRFEAPAPGRWTVEVRVVFAMGAGTASYFWQLAVD